jgi:tRNA(Ile)-lysidine synthase
MQSSEVIPERVERQLSRLIPGWPDARLCVALSGGVDSAALLQACHGIRARQPAVTLRAIHVSHGLQPTAADWPAICAALCTRLDVPFETIDLQLVPPPGASVEAAARDARYAALQSRLAPGEALLTAHHQDDQLETVLLQLFRGAGLAGIAAMPASAPLGHGLLLRPLLGVTRAEIDAYARAAGIGRIEDPMNLSPRFDRGLLRRDVIPVVRARWRNTKSSARRLSMCRCRTPSTPSARTTWSQRQSARPTWRVTTARASGRRRGAKEACSPCIRRRGIKGLGMR